jgi:hypothetical protein
MPSNTPTPPPDDVVQQLVAGTLAQRVDAADEVLQVDPVRHHHGSRHFLV